MIKVIFDLQNTTHEYENAFRTITEGIYEEVFNDLSNDSSVPQVNIAYRVVTEVQGNQKNPWLIKDSHIANNEGISGQLIEVLHGDKGITTPKGKISSKFTDAMVIAIPTAILAQLFQEAIKGKDKVRAKGSGTQRFLSTMTTEFKKRGLSCADGYELLPTDRIMKLVDKYKKEIDIIRSLELSNVDRKPKKATVKKDVVMCSVDCELAKVLQIRAVPETTMVWVGLPCPKCHQTWHIKGTKTEPTIVEQATELIKQS